MSSIERDLAFQDRLLRHGIIFPEEFKNKLRALILEGLRNTPFRQMQSGFLMQGASLQRDGVSEGNYDWGSGFHTGPDSGYVSLSSPRTKTGIADGRYLLLWGVSYSTSTDYFVGIKVNSTDPVDSNSLAGKKGTAAIIREIVLDQGNNSLEMKVKIPASASGTFDNSFVALIRLGSVL